MDLSFSAFSLPVPRFDHALPIAANGRLARFVSGFAANPTTVPAVFSPVPATPFATPVTLPIAFAAEVDISPAWIDCQPALSARMPVSSAVDFFAASKPP